MTYISRPYATPEAELNALVNVYAYLIKTHNSNKSIELAREPDDRNASLKSRRQGKEDTMT